MLGKIYHYAVDVVKDLPKAIEYYQKAADIGLSEAKDKLNEAKYEAFFIFLQEKRYEAGVNYLKEAAEGGYLPALLTLGNMFAEGETVQVKKSYEEFVAFYKDHSQEKRFRDKPSDALYSEEVLVPKDMSKAIHYYQLAADRGYEPAVQALAKIREKNSNSPERSNLSQRSEDPKKESKENLISSAALPPPPTKQKKDVSSAVLSSPAKQRKSPCERILSSMAFLFFGKQEGIRNQSSNPVAASSSELKPFR